MTLFTRIIKGEIPSYKVAEDDKHYAFLDINPLAKGHTLVIPKLAEPEADYIFDLTDEQLQGLITFAKKVAVGIKAATGCMLFTNPKLSLPAEEMAIIANSIAEAIEHRPLR